MSKLRASDGSKLGAASAMAPGIASVVPSWDSSDHDMLQPVRAQTQRRTPADGGGDDWEGAVSEVMIEGSEVDEDESEMSIPEELPE